MLQQRMRPVVLLPLVIGMTAASLLSTGPAAAQATPSPDDQAKIADAMSAGPDSISRDATILDWTMDDSGHFVVLRKGTNSWTCFPDVPSSPTDDPMCLDPTWMDWGAARANHTDPHTTVPGIAYMLQGATDASNTDPYATEPAPGDDWVVSPPHIMILLPEGIDHSVFTADYMAGGPSIMWPGTPYEHIMMPVKAGDAMTEMAATPAP